MNEGRVKVKVHATINEGKINIGKDVEVCSRCGQKLRK